MTSATYSAFSARIRKTVPVAFAAALGLVLANCAAVRIKPDSQTIYVRPTERLFFRIAPFDSVVKAELSRAGIDPVRFEEELNTEVRYRFTVRKQEEAQDSVGAVAVLQARVLHLQPGVGNAGTYGEFEVSGRRRKEPLYLKWTWEVPSKQNKPADMLSRDLNRGVADELMKRIRKMPPRPKEPPPPLQLL